MLEKPTFRSTWLPLGLAGIALILLNIGLYTRLAAQPAVTGLSLPYDADYTNTDISEYVSSGGNWEIRDETLVQLNTAGFDLGTFIPLDIPSDESYSFEAQMRFIGGANGGGIIFNAQQPGNRQQSQLARFNVDGGQLWLIYGYFGDNSDFQGQGSTLLTIPPGNTDPHVVRVEVGSDSYKLLIDGQTLASDVPLQYQGGAVGLLTAAAQVSFDNVHAAVLTADATTEAAVVTAPIATDVPVSPAESTVAVVPSTSVSTELMPVVVFDDAFAGDRTTQSFWIPFSGTWAFEQGAFVQSQVDGYDFDASYRQSVGRPYLLRVALQHRQGAGGGVLFNMPQPDRKQGAYMVRYIDNEVAWGYFDDAGNFQGQGNTPVNSPGTDSHIFEVSVVSESYTIQLDGVTLAENVPLLDSSDERYIGLTSSLSSVAFTQVTVFGNTEMLDTSAVTGNIDVSQAASGTWNTNGEHIIQSATDKTDYLAGTGIAAHTFTISVDILLPPDSADTGGGLTFHMDGRDDVRGGYMVRLAEGGKSIFWGHYDENAVFQGQGNAALNLTPDQPATLTLTVHADNLDIQVNGANVALAIPLTSQTGWVGLLTFSGPVEFSNIRLQPGVQ